MGIRKAYPMATKNEEAANVMAFDALYTTNQIQKFKVLLPYIEPSMQKHLAVYIKYMELQYTMRYVRNDTDHVSTAGAFPGNVCRSALRKRLCILRSGQCRVRADGSFRNGYDNEHAYPGTAGNV